MRLAQPPGARSCRDGGNWDVCRDDRGANYWMRELEHLKASLTDIEFKLMQQELKWKMDRAKAGECTYGSGREFDVEQMACTTDVLELRLTTRTGEDEEEMHIRLFFTEPEKIANQMLALMLTWKRPGPVGLDEQTEQAQSSSRRADEHELWRANSQS